MRLRAKWVLPVGAPPVANGVVEVRGDRIVSVGAAGTADRDLGDVVLLPGLINAHCHLDYTDMRGQVPWRGDFGDWLARITALKKTRTAAQYEQSIRRGAMEALATGTTTVVNVGGSGVTVAGLPNQIWWCVELIDLTWSEESVRLAERAAEWVAANPPAGLAPHAPYTVSEPLYRLAAKLAREHGWLVTTHAAETRGEDRRWHVALGENCLVAHANWITEAEAVAMGTSGTSVAHCPRTHRFFERPPAPVELWRQHGINICLGTDSLASNESLDMLAEMREFARAWPAVPAREVVAMATVNPARALGQAGSLGTLAAGAVADMVAVPARERDPVESVLAAERVVWMMRAGKEVAGGENA